MKVNAEERRDKAVELYRQGYNCAQAVSMAYADIIGLDEKTVAKISASFGGGMGRMGEVCGTLTGAFMVVGSVYPYTDPADRSNIQKNFAMVRQISNDFRERLGDIICRNLTNKKDRTASSTTDNDPNTEYYRQRPCAYCVAYSALLLGEEINNRD